MSAEASSVETKARTLRLSKEADLTATRMASDLGISVNELIRRALGTEKFLLEASREGKKILLKSADGNMTEVVIR